MLPFQQSQAQLGTLGTISDLINSAVTGAKTGGAGLGALVGQEGNVLRSQQLEQQQSQFEQQQLQNLIANALGIGAGLLPRDPATGNISFS
jgi:hypothetical protein